MRPFAFALLLAAACGPSLEARQSKERLASIAWESSLAYCVEARKLQAAGGGAGDVVASACAAAEEKRAAFLTACQAARGDAAACELAAQRIERRP